MAQDIMSRAVLLVYVFTCLLIGLSLVILSGATLAPHASAGENL